MRRCSVNDERLVALAGHFHYSRSYTSCDITRWWVSAISRLCLLRSKDGCGCSERLAKQAELFLLIYGVTECIIMIDLHFWHCDLRAFECKLSIKPKFKIMEKLMYKRLSDFPEIIRFCMNINLVLERIIQHHRRVVLLCDPLFSRFSRTLTCDRRTDRHRHAQGHSMYRASIASRGKNCRQFQQVTRQPFWNNSREVTGFMRNRLSLSSYSHVTFLVWKLFRLTRDVARILSLGGLSPWPARSASL